MLTAFLVLPSPVPRFLVHLHLQALQQLVQAGENVHHRHEFEYALIIQPELPHRGSVNFNSVLAPANR